MGAFEEDGFEVIEGVLTAGECADIAHLATEFKRDAAGSRRLLAHGWCRELADRLRSLPALGHVLPAGHVAMQCTYFEKSLARNWLVPIHQDRSIPVAERVEDTALRGWSEKEGELFVQPPEAILRQVVALRLHLDEVGEEDGPLEVVPGSHGLGVIGNEEAIRLRQRNSTRRCLGGRGSVLAMRPLLLHQSSKARGERLRRTLDFRYGPPQLPFGLKWRHPV